MKSRNTRRAFSAYSPLPVRLGVLAVGDAGEGFAEGVTPLADGSAVAREVEPHAAVDGVEAVTVQELDASAAPAEPLLPRLDRVVQFAQEPRRTTLLPHALVVVQQRAVPVAGDQVPAELFVDATGKPEGERVAQQAVTVYGGQLRDTVRRKRVFGIHIFRQLIEFLVLPPNAEDVRLLTLGTMTVGSNHKRPDWQDLEGEVADAARLLERSLVFG